MPTILPRALVDTPPRAASWPTPSEENRLKPRDRRPDEHEGPTGVLVGSRLDGDVRTVTFADGAVVRERLVTVDDRQRRLVYTVIEGATTHHNSSFEVVADAEGRCRVIWISDFLPDSIEPMIRALVDQGAQALRSTLEAAR